MRSQLKALRLQAGFTQSQLACKVERPVRWVQRIESGDIKIENVTLGNAKALAKALDCDIEDLIK